MRRTNNYQPTYQTKRAAHFHAARFHLRLGFAYWVMDGFANWVMDGFAYWVMDGFAYWVLDGFAYWILDGFALSSAIHHLILKRA